MVLEQQDVYICSLGDSALVIQLGEGISSLIHNKIINIVDSLEADPFEGFIEAIPGYNNVTVFYDPVIVHLNNSQNMQPSPFKIVSDFMMFYIERSNKMIETEKRLVEIPVSYGEELGPDLEYVAMFNNITPEMVIKLHAQKDYLIYMIGFAPGFPHLGNIDKKITTPRKEKPRPRVSAGSVGIAGKQTGIYSLESPGGWQVIGQTPVNLFNPKSAPPTLLKPGDKIRFIPITKDEFISYKENKQ